MSPTATRYTLWIVQGLLTLAFVAAGLAKLAGAEQMVQVFETVGFGQWFRYVTGLIEIGGAVLLWVPGMQLVGAGLLLATMVGAVIAHLTVLGPTALPALVLGVLAAVVLWLRRPAGATA